MATRGLKKVIRKIYLNSNEKDPIKRTFNPYNYPKNWNNAIKYINAKDRRMAFNKIFRPLFADIFAADVKAYLAGGHKLTSALKKQMRLYAKEKASEITKTKLAAQTTAQQSFKEQEDVLPEG